MSTPTTDEQLREQVLLLIDKQTTAMSMNGKAYPKVSRESLAEEYMQLLTQARKDPDRASETRLDTILRSVRDAGALDDNFGGEDWSHSEQVIRNAKAQIQARKGYVPEGVEKYDDLDEIIIAALACDTKVHWTYKQRKAVRALFDGLYTQAELDQKVAEARLDVINGLVPKSKRYAATDNTLAKENKRGWNACRQAQIALVKAKRAQLTNPHTPPQVDKGEV